MILAVIYVFNTTNGNIETYYRDKSEPMPYNVGGTLTVGEFLGSYDTGWTDDATMRAWNQFRAFVDRPIHVDYAFRRVTDYGCEDNAQHYAGTAFSVGSDLPQARLRELYDEAVSSGAWNNVVELTARSTMVQFDKRYQPSTSFTSAGWPNLWNGRAGNQVFVLQDTLNKLGYNAGALDGRFGPNTERALRRFQAARFLTEDGIASRMEWESLLNMECL